MQLGTDNLGLLTETCTDKRVRLTDVNVGILLVLIS